MAQKAAQRESVSDSRCAGKTKAGGYRLRQGLFAPA
jgi:hypothetical protein